MFISTKINNDISNLRGSSNIFIDIRSITHLLYVYSVIGEEIFNKSMIIWSGKNSDLILARQLVNLDAKVFYIDKNNSFRFLDKYKMLFKICKICKIFKSLNIGNNESVLLTCFASGELFEILSGGLKISNKNIYQFDDGTHSKLRVKNNFSSQFSFN